MFAFGENLFKLLSNINKLYDINFLFSLKEIVFDFSYFILFLSVDKVYGCKFPQRNNPIHKTAWNILFKHKILKMSTFYEHFAY